MLETLHRYRIGTVLLSLSGQGAERFLNLCKNKSIPLWNIKAQGDGFSLELEAADFRKLKPLVRKTHVKIRVQQKKGFPFLYRRERKRKAFYLGFCTCIICIFMLSLRIWEISLEGNESLTTEHLKNYLSTIHIQPGMEKKKAHCEEIETSLREAFPKLTWVSVSKEGACLRIHMQESRDTIKAVEKEAPSNLIATEDGIIQSIITRSGVPKVRKGDAVKKGDLLISGQMEVLDDSQSVAGYRYLSSQGEVKAEVTYPYEERLSLTYEKKEATGKCHVSYGIATKNKIFFLRLPVREFSKETKLSMEKKIRIREEIVLPFALRKEICREYKIVKKTYSKEEARKILSKQFQAYRKQLEEEKQEILAEDVSISFAEGIAVAKGSITVSKDIGKQIPLDVDFQGVPVVE